MATLTTNKGEQVLIDDEDYELLSQYTWRKYAYNRHVHTSINQQTILIHRMLMKPAEGMVVDHINGDPLDNRKANLRVCTQAENTMNRRPNYRGASKFKGVTKHGKRWRAQINRDGVKYDLGCFDCETQAAAAYNGAAIVLCGKFAHLNKIPRDK